MKGIILINAYFNKEEYLYQPKRLKEEFNKLGVSIDIIKNDSYLIKTYKDKIYNGACGYDFCVFLDKDKYVLKGLENSGIPLFNGYDAITTCDDKMLTYLALTKNNISCPKTLPGILCFDKKEKIKDVSIENIEKELSYPIIIKRCYGSMGKGVFLNNDRSELIKTLDKVKCEPHLIQEYIKESCGKDVRVMVIGGKVIGAIIRKSKKDFRSNLGVGGVAEVYSLNKETERLAEKVAKTLKLDYCGIDLLFKKDGSFLVCEVNSNAFFYGFEKTTNINVAKIYAEYILSKLKK